MTGPLSFGWMSRDSTFDRGIVVFDYTPEVQHGP